MRSGAFTGPDSGTDGIVGGPLIESRPGALTAARALLLGVLLIMVGNGLQSAVLGVRIEYEDFGLTVGGLIMGAYYFGYLLGTKAAERQLAAVGHIRVFAALASLFSATSILHLLWIHPLSWALLRLLSGLCMAGIFVTTESWLNDMAGKHDRGRILSMYMVVSMGGLSLGQFLLNAADPAGVRLFLVVSALVSLALVPVTLSASSAPPLVVPERVSFREVFQTVPVSIVTVFWSGLSHGALLGAGALYGAAQDLSTAKISLILSVPTFGAIVFQWPVGWLSDRVPRRGVLFGVAVASVAFSTLMLFLEPGSIPWYLLLWLFGGSTYSLYALAVSFVADWMPAEKFNGASAAIVRSVGVGAVLGPITCGVIMAATHPAAFLVVLAVSHAAIALYVAWGILARAALPVSKQRRFINWPAHASAMAANLLRQPRRR